MAKRNKKANPNARSQKIMKLGEAIIVGNRIYAERVVINKRGQEVKERVFVAKLEK